MKRAEQMRRRAQEAEKRALEYERRAAEVQGSDRRAKIRRGVLLSYARTYRKAAALMRAAAEEMERRGRE